MATQIHYKSGLPGYYPMRDLHDDSNSDSWPLFYGDKNLPNGQCYTGFTPRTIVDAYPGCDKNALKQKMLEHETIFRNQVYELHRLYRVQRDMMEEFRKKNSHKHRGSIEPSSSSSFLGSQAPSEDTRKWHVTSYAVTNSPLSCTKRHTTLASQLTSQNGSTLKDCEILEVRPSKVRKKLFDLHLPADEYIDSDDAEQHEIKISGISTPNGEYKVASESTRDSHLSSSVGLADLNEPVEVEVSTGPSLIDIFGSSANSDGVEGIDLSAKRNSKLLSMQKEVIPRSHQGSHNGLLNKFSMETKVNEKEWLSEGLPRGKLPLPSPPALKLNQARSLAIHLSDHNKEDILRERASWGSRNYSNDSNLESNLTSQVPNPPHPFVGSSDAASTWPRFVSSWGKPSFNTHPSLISSSSLSKTFQSSAHSHDFLGEKWNINGNCRLSGGLGTYPASHNGFHPGSSSGSKDLPFCLRSVDFNYVNGGRSDNITSEQLINQGLEKSRRGSNYVDQKPAKDMNLNVAFLNNSLKEAVVGQDLEILDERNRHEDHPAMLPWLRAKPAGKSEGTKSSVGKTEMVKDLNQMFIGVSASNTHEIRPKEDTSETHRGRKILGSPIFEKVSTSKNDSSLLVSSNGTLHPTSEGKDVKHEGRNILIDINVACDEPVGDEMVMEKALDNNSSYVRNFIDLNSCVTEDEDPPVPSAASNVSSVKVVVEIDLEAPPGPESEEDILPTTENEQETAPQPSDYIMEQGEDEILRSAAEAIVDISSSCRPSDASSAGSLLWFANVVVFTADEMQNKSGEETKGGESGHDKGSIAFKEMDDFEAMTLQLPETKEEHYMPDPFVPEVEETETKPLPTRTRRGQARRGRQRRDFQRDILPGLASLARHEVTEDLQTFGGLMKATGHSWNSGLTRRNGSKNGGTRGRRRTVVETPPTATPSAVCSPLVQQLNNIETGLEDGSITGWGKTPRRPRRPRCPAGNPPPTIPST